MDKYGKLIRKNWKWLKKKPNVVGVDGILRSKIRNKKAYSNIKCIRVYVSKKVPMVSFVYAPSLFERIKRLVGRSSILTKKDLVPQWIEGIPTDIIDTGPMKANRPVPLDPKKKYRPMIAGVSACHKDGTACTSTAFFLDEETLSKVFIALNNHCGALENKASIGDPWINPSDYDNGKYPDDLIARLHHFVEIKYNGFTCPYRNSLHKAYRFFKQDLPVNRVDISFGDLLVDYKVESLNIKDAFIGKRLPDLEEQVQKNGRTTDYTIGKVTSLDWIGTVQYGRGIVAFVDCILVEGFKFSQGGDSGSPVFDMKGNLVGILFAGSDDFTIICKIENVLKEGKVVLITKGNKVEI